MSRLYGYLSNERGGVSTRAAHRHIQAIVQTQEHRLTLFLLAEGHFILTVAQASPGGGWSGTKYVLSGEINECGDEVAQ